MFIITDTNLNSLSDKIMKNSGNQLEKCKQAYILIDETIETIKKNSKNIVTKKQILIDKTHLGICASLTRKINDDVEKKIFNPENLRQIDDDSSVDVIGGSQDSDSSENFGNEFTNQINLL
ncbi:MAG: hypothetical protein EKK61_04380 [Rickettsiales bacterium]|nr:MAG: hypothetical protein EKK61_04380 [Rickettsiales bacterium]